MHIGAFGTSGWQAVPNFNSFRWVCLYKAGEHKKSNFIKLGVCVPSQEKSPTWRSDPRGFGVDNSTLAVELLSGFSPFTTKVASSFSSAPRPAGSQ